MPRGYPGERPDVCPGYLVQLPQVEEAYRAYSWRKEGALREFYGGQPLTPLAKFAIDTAAGEARAVEQHCIREAREK